MSKSIVNIYSESITSCDIRNSNFFWRNPIIFSYVVTRLLLTNQLANRFFEIDVKYHYLSPNVIKCQSNGRNHQQPTVRLSVCTLIMDPNWSILFHIVFVYMIFVLFVCRICTKTTQTRSSIDIFWYNVVFQEVDKVL